MKRLSLGLLLSCAAHAAVVAGAVAVVDIAAPHVLFVDLVHGLGLAVSGSGAGGGGSSGEPGAGAKADVVRTIEEVRRSGSGPATGTGARPFTEASTLPGHRH